MSVTVLRPDATVTNSIPVYGGGTAHGALSDNSDSTYLAPSAAGQNGTFSLADPSLPAGHAVAAVYVRVRQNASPAYTDHLLLKLDTGSGSSLILTQVMPSTASTSVIESNLAVIAAGFTQAQAAALRVIVEAQRLGVYIMELYADVVYATIPALVVSSPTGTVTDTNRPLIDWSTTFDTVGRGLNTLGPYSQTHRHVRIFTAAQYGAGGFDPATSTATQELPAEMATSGTFWVPPVPLVNDSYRAYVRTANTLPNGSVHWSAWEFTAFTVNVALPADPTLTVTAENASGRVRADIAANTGAATTDGFELQRSVDAGVSWQPVRNQEGDAGTTVTVPVTIYDYEAAHGTQTLYRARARHDYSGVFAESAWIQNQTTLVSDAWWIVDVLRPARTLKMPTEMYSYSDVQRAARQAIAQPLGGAIPYVLEDTRAGETGSITLQLSDAAMKATLAVLLGSPGAQPSTLLLVGPSSHGHPARFVRFGDHGSSRVIDKSWSHLTRDVLPWTLVVAPTGAQTGAQYTVPPSLEEIVIV